MNYEEFIRTYDTVVKLPVSNELICLEFAKIIVEKKIIEKEGDVQSNYFFNIADILKSKNLFTGEFGIKLVGTLGRYKKHIYYIVNLLTMVGSEKYSSNYKDMKDSTVVKAVDIDGQFNIALSYGRNIDGVCDGIYLSINCASGLELDTKVSDCEECADNSRCFL